MNPIPRINPDLEIEWNSLCSRTGMDPNLFPVLQAAYIGKSYHNLGHIRECLTLAEAYENINDTIRIAIWFHDVVYIAGNPYNEEQSYDFFRYHVGENEDVKRLILATKHKPASSMSHDEAIIRDVDLYGLGNPWADYNRNRSYIREEFLFFDEARWRIGRMAFLNSMLDRPHLYHTYDMQHRTTQARMNLLREKDEILGQ